MEGPFDPKYNEVKPKPAPVAPVADTADKTQKPTVVTPDTVDPSNVFNDAYNLVPKSKDKPADAPKPDKEFDSKFNQLNKVSDFPAQKDRPQPFSQNGEIGKLFVNDKTGFVSGMQFTEGSRKGQKYAFDRDPNGNITKIHMLMPGKDAAPPQYLTFDKTDKGWAAKPAGQLVPGFKNLKVENGLITGDFKVNAKGDFGYESADKQIRSVVRINGDKDNFDMRDYSRERESNGKKSTTYWNGYDWLPGQPKQLAPGVIQVDFPAQPGKPTSTIRDANNNGFRVAFTKEQTQYIVGNWNDGTMRRQQGAVVDTLYTTGAKDAQGKLQWRKGQIKAEGTQRVVTFNDGQDAAKIKAGELPKTAIIDPKTGAVTSVYSNETKVVADDRGTPQKIIYKNQQQVDILRDANFELKGYRRSDGTTIMKGADLAQGPAGSQGSAWTVQRPGQAPLTINGILKPGNAGSFSIQGAGNDGLTINPEGLMSTNLAGKVVSDRPGTGDKPPVAPPIVKDAPPPVKPADKPPEAPKPADKVTPGRERGKAPITDEQLKALYAKYKLDPKIQLVINQQKERAERQGLQKTFTQENLDTLLKLADKHKLLADFSNTAVLGRNRDRNQSKPGAIIGRLIPELLEDPTKAIDLANAESKKSMTKALTGQVPQARIDSVMKTIDATYSELRRSTQPFVDELTKELKNRPAPTPPPQPVPLPR